MTNEQVIDRLKLKNWYFKCQTKKDANLLLQACNDAGITWAQGEKPTEWYPYESYPFDIGFFEKNVGITHDYYNIYEKYELENITDWFFNAIQDADGKLTPQNAEQEHWVQIILARIRGIPIESFSPLDGTWVDDKNNNLIFMNCEYRIKPEPASTPLPISRDAWKFLDKNIRFIAMDKYGSVFVYRNRPKRYESEWRVPGNAGDKWTAYPLDVTTDGINWETSLTERPEDV